jgi:arsenite methyltransferase
MEMPRDDELRQKVAERYDALARGVLERDAAIDAPLGCTPDGNAMSRDLYADDQPGNIPPDAMVASLGCGNPTALIDLEEGQVVLDLGSGGGIDVLLSARRVGPTGKVYGLDMADEMLELARRNQHEAGVENVEFLKGIIEAVPLPDETVDVVISNCVINLAVDKSEVFAEAFRVLRPGGRFAVSDIVIRGDLDPLVLRTVEAWMGCLAGALRANEYCAGLEAAGFVDIEIQPTRVYTFDDARELLEGVGIDEHAAVAAGGDIVSAFVRASKPA